VASAGRQDGGLLANQLGDSLKTTEKYRDIQGQVDQDIVMFKRISFPAQMYRRMWARDESIGTKVPELFFQPLVLGGILGMQVYPVTQPPGFFRESTGQ